MERIFLFLYQYRAFFTFVILEFLCGWMFIANNQYQGALFFNSSNSFVASINGVSQNVREYFDLREINQTLSEENTRLRKQASQQLNLQQFGPPVITDSALVNRFDFVNAKVVNNSVGRFTNFITINQGNNAGIRPGMAVISSAGAIGKVKTTSDHFSVVTSLLNVDVMISGVLKRTGHFGTVKWEGEDPDHTTFKYIPRHVKPVNGDTIVTSGYGGIFPEGILIGTVTETRLNKEAPFYEIKVKLAQDFRKLSFVAVVKSNLLNELDSLELRVPDMKQ
jgi:rod shape-determining protein MreC